jgi:hypothetical protein
LHFISVFRLSDLITEKDLQSPIYTVIVDKYLTWVELDWIGLEIESKMAVTVDDNGVPAPPTGINVIVVGAGQNFQTPPKFSSNTNTSQVSAASQQQ